MKRYDKNTVTKVCDVIAKNINKTNYEIAQLINAAGFTKTNGGKFSHTDVQGFYTRHAKEIGRSNLATGGKMVRRNPRKTKSHTATTTTNTATQQREDDSTTLVYLILDAKLSDAKKLALIKATLQTRA
jgi:hypothetical protein